MPPPPAPALRVKPGSLAWLGVRAVGAGLAAELLATAPAVAAAAAAGVGDAAGRRLQIS
jgi:hypothetical protein